MLDIHPNARTTPATCAEAARQPGGAQGRGKGTVWMILLGLAPLALALPAFAETMTSTRHSLMCASPDALARLVLPGGQSRIGTSSEASGDRQAALSGGCVDVPPGTQVEVQSARTNTSVVTFDARDGRGPRTLVAPNANFTHLPSAASASSGNCLRFDAVSPQITLAGVVQPRQHLETRPGGDPESERDLFMDHFLVLVLDKPLCVQITGGFVAVPPSTVREIDVEGTAPNPKVLLRPWISRRVALTGQLSWRGRASEAFTDPYLELTKPQVQAAPP